MPWMSNSALVELSRPQTGSATSLMFSRFCLLPAQLFQSHLLQCDVQDKENAQSKSAIDCFFLEQDGTSFKVAIPHAPYFFVIARGGANPESALRDLEAWLRRKYGSQGLADVINVAKIDLTLPNHLAGLKRHVLQLKFTTVSDLMKVRNELRPIARQNAARSEPDDDQGYAYAEGDGKAQLVALREDDVTYYERGSLLLSRLFSTSGAYLHLHLQVRTITSQMLPESYPLSTVVFPPTSSHVL